jgi:hypothetical protein
MCRRNIFKIVLRPLLLFNTDHILNRTAVKIVLQRRHAFLSCLFCCMTIYILFFDRYFLIKAPFHKMSEFTITKFEFSISTKKTRRKNKKNATKTTLNINLFGSISFFSTGTVALFNATRKLCLNGKKKFSIYVFLLLLVLGDIFYPSFIES